MKLFVLAAACGLLLSPAVSVASEGAAAAQPAQQAQQVASNGDQSKPAEPAAAPAKAKKEKKVCHRFGASESRLGGGTVCKTQAEWDATKGVKFGSAADR